MLKRLFFICIALFVGISCSNPSNRSTSDKLNIIFETDIGNDVDDALALDLLYKYMDAGKIQLLGITINKEGSAPAEFVDIMNTWYGYPTLPIGIIHDGADCETDAINYAQAVVNQKNADGLPLFARSIKDYSKLDDAVTLYRKLLSKAEDKSIVIVSVGFSTNLAALMDSPSDAISPLKGKDLITKKVKFLCTMAGCFNNPDLHEYNVIKDIPAAQKVFHQWPTPIVTSPFEVGIAINYPGESIANDFTWAPQHPMVEAYKAYLPMPYDRPTWDLTSVLYAVEGAGYFTQSSTGTIHVADNASTTFEESTEGNRSYLSVTEEQAENIKQHFITLLTAKPANKL